MSICSACVMERASERIQCAQSEFDPPPRSITLPLAGVKVVDFSEHGFVPSAAAALADWVPM